MTDTLTEADCTCVQGEGCDQEGKPGCAYCRSVDCERPCPAEGTGYCGCCGNETAREDDLWCPRCIGHVGSHGPLWERTWAAVTGEECPYQVPIGGANQHE